MFRGINTATIDEKGRLAIPAAQRDRLRAFDTDTLVMTLNPWDRCLWLYPVREWERIEEKLQGLSDYDLQSRRTKQILRGYASERALDGQGRVLIPQELRGFAGIEKQVVVLGQGNKCEIWNEAAWTEQRDEWLKGLGGDAGEPPSTLGSLSL